VLQSTLPRFQAVLARLEILATGHQDGAFGGGGEAEEARQGQGESSSGYDGLGPGEDVEGGEGGGGVELLPDKTSHLTRASVKAARQVQLLRSCEAGRRFSCLSGHGVRVRVRVACVCRFVPVRARVGP